MIARLDAVLGRVSTFRIVIGALVALVVVSIVYGLIGASAFRAAEQLASLAVILVVAHLVNALAARIARVSPNLASTTVTALVLFFLLPPHLDLPRLGLTAIAAAVAAASKYLIAVRGRHVLNPAAFGGFVASVLGLGPAIWWVATPLMLPFVTIAALTVLIRVRHVLIGVVMVGLATVIISARMVGLGLDPWSAVALALGSFPLVFLAGFMLSEPLTLPPRRWQQLIVAAIVAVVLAVPFSTGTLDLGGYEVGPISSTPEFALIVGNIVAFFFGQRRGITLELVAKRQLTPTSWDFEFRPLAPVHFQAGQFVEIALPHRHSDAKGTRRVFSIASASPESIRLGVKTTPPVSSFKQLLLDLEPGARVGATGVGGDFVLPRDPGTPLLLVAGGIGITPFVGHLEQLAAAARDAGVEPDAVVVYAVSSPQELAYLPELSRSGARILVASPSEPEEPAATWTWLGPERLTAATIMTAVPDATRRQTYLSGPPDLVESLRHALRRAGVRHIRTDVFLGY